MNKPGPCLDKNCSWCCDPVKIGSTKGRGFSDFNKPKDKNGNDIWKDTGETWIPESQPDSVRVMTFNCINHDKENNRCKDYENRPDICRKTSCVEEECDKSIDEQHKELVNEKFFKIR